MNAINTLALIGFLFPLAYSPGPGNQFFAALGARVGLRGVGPALVGYHVATWVVTFAIGVGMGAALLDRPAVLDAMAVAGGVYMMWLGFQAWRTAGNQHRHPSPEAASATPHPGFGAGVLLLVLNGKAFVIIALMFATFSAEGSLSTAAWICTVFTLNNLVAFLAWAVLGVGAAGWARRVGAEQTVDRIFAAGIALVGCWLIMRTMLAT